MSFYSYANRTHFRKKGCAPVLKLQGFGSRKWPIGSGCKAVEVAFVSHSILKQIGEPLGKVKAVHSPSPSHWVAKPIAVLSKELKMAVIDNSALKQYLHEAQCNTCIRGTLSSVSLTQRNVNVIPRVCSLLCPLAFAGSSIYNLQDIVS